jgi:hypothetical protein
MVMNDPLTRAEARVQRYWNVDGLHEIAAALLFALTAVWVWATDLSSLPRAWKGAFSITFPVMLWAGIWAEGRVVGAIRRRLTIPRAGFVAFRKPPRRKQAIVAGAAFLVAAAIAVLIVRDSGSLLRWGIAFAGLGVATFLGSIGWRTGLVRFFLVGFLMLAAGIAIPLSGMDLSRGMMLYWLIAGGTFLISGGVTLWRFLHAPLAPTER